MIILSKYQYTGAGPLLCSPRGVIPSFTPQPRDNVRAGDDLSTGMEAGTCFCSWLGPNALVTKPVWSNGRSIDGVETVFPRLLEC